MLWGNVYDGTIKILKFPKIRFPTGPYPIKYFPTGPMRVCVCLCVCMYVCLQLFSGMEIARKLILSIMVGYRSGTKPIEFGVNLCNNNVTAYLILYITPHR